MLLILKTSLPSGTFDCWDRFLTVFLYSRKLQELKIPNMAFGNLYISGNPMDLYIRKGKIKNGFKPHDFNTYTFHDKIEFSYTNAGIWVNPRRLIFFFANPFFWTGS